MILQGYLEYSSLHLSKMPDKVTYNQIFFSKMKIVLSNIKKMILIVNKIIFDQIHLKNKTTKL